MRTLLLSSVTVQLLLAIAMVSAILLPLPEEDQCDETELEDGLLLVTTLDFEWSIRCSLINELLRDQSVVSVINMLVRSQRLTNQDKQMILTAINFRD